MLYVHVPFCGSFCTYCDFYSEIACDRKAEFGRYADELCSEAISRASEIADTLAVNTLYFGGGTPSVLPVSLLEKIVSSLNSSVPGFDAASCSEFTVEVNPEDIAEKGEVYVRSLLALGVNRISMGVQSLDDGMLRWMGRRHSAAGAEKAYGILRSAGVGNVSVDLMTGISGMDDRMLMSTLEKTVSWAPEHVSAYQLSIEEGSTLGRMVEAGGYAEASQEQCRRQYDMVCDVLRKAGYVHYEISNWAKPGYEAVHNSAYWTRAPYVGLGPGAHSLRRDGAADVRSWNSCALSGWKQEMEVLSEDEIREEEIMLGLRTRKGYGGKVLSESEWFVSDDIISSLI